MLRRVLRSRIVCRDKAVELCRRRTGSIAKVGLRADKGGGHIQFVDRVQV